MYFYRYFNPEHSIRFDSADDGGSGGDGGDGSGDQKKKKSVEAPPLSEEVLSSIKNLVNRAGNESEALKVVYNDNKNLRDKLRDAEGNTLGDGKVAIEEEKAQIIQKVEDLGGWDELTKKVNGYDEAVTELSQIKKQSKVRQLANGYGYNFDVLNDLISPHELEIKEEKDDKGNTVEKGYLKINGEGDQVELKKYIEEKKAPYLPALEKDSTSKGGRRITRQDSNSNGSANGSDSVVSKVRERRKKEAESGNPLNPKQQ